MNRVKHQLGIESFCRRADRNISVVVLDTGVVLHPDLRNSSVKFLDLVKERKEPYDDNGHGTHVCGIIAGDGMASHGRISGIAPGVSLKVCKILDSQGEGELDRLLSACDWISQMADKEKMIVNISVAMQKKLLSIKQDLLLERLNLLWKQGVLIICSAGNNGPGSGTITGLSSSCSVIVGCNDGPFRKGDPNLCEHYSGEGEDTVLENCPDIVAPGSYILSCSHRYNGYSRKSGTSMATAIVSGLAAQYYCRFPEATNQDFKNVIKNTATDLGIPVRKQGAGMVNPKAFLTLYNRN